METIRFLYSTSVQYSNTVTETIEAMKATVLCGFLAIRKADTLLNCIGLSSVALNPERLLLVKNHGFVVLSKRRRHFTFDNQIAINNFVNLNSGHVTISNR